MEIKYWSDEVKMNDVISPWQEISHERAIELLEMMDFISTDIKHSSFQEGMVDRHSTIINNIACAIEFHNVSGRYFYVEVPCLS
jgi:hypothetical protein